jgi:hypothetical protein
LVSAAVGTHTVIARNPEAPTTKAMPVNCIGVQVFRGSSPTLALPLADCAFFDSRSKQPMMLSTSGETQGHRLTYFARYFTRSGPAGAAQYGPWSDGLTASVL